jgi:HEAT repeat protein
MKLIEQISLWNREGSADKVYEVDLCEVGPNQYVVNFRYGRRGAILKDGTKTTLPVALPDGERIFKQLVTEKKKGGYQETSHFQPGQTTQTTSPAAQSVIASTISSTDKKAFVLSALQQATQPDWNQKKWPLSRIIWRVGELKIQEAAPQLIPLLLKGDALQQYSVCWALGRCGDPVAVPILEQIYKAAASKEFVRRMAFTSMMALEKNAAKRTELANSWLQNMVAFLEPMPSARNQQTDQNGGFSAFWKRTSGQPASTPANEAPKADPVLEKIANDLRQAIGTVNANAVIAVLEPALNKVITYSVLESLYLFSEDFTQLRTVILSFLQKIPFKPNAFKAVRHIFKIAEFREDAEVLALLFYRLEQTKPYFSFRYGREYGLYDAEYNYIQKPVQELQKQYPRLAYSNLTADYFKRRGWRILRTLGEDEQDTYIILASAVLLSLSDEKDKTEAKETQTTTWHYNQQTRQYVEHTRVTQYDTYANWLTFNYILYQNSPRYEHKKNTKAWRCKANYLPGQPAPEQREEAFPGLWDKHPRTLLQLLVKSENYRVHEFAIRALKNRADLTALVDLDTLVELLTKPYPDTVRLAINLVKHFYDPQNPNLDLMRMLIHSPLAEARTLVQQWVEAQPEYFQKRTLLFIDLIINPYEDVWIWTRNLLAKTIWEEENTKVFIGQVLAELLSLPPDNEMANVAAEGAAQTLVNFLLPLLQELNVVVVQDLLRHPLPGVQTLGAIILLHHRTPPHQLPAGLLSSLIQSPVPAVRQTGVQLFGKMPESTLLESYELIAAFCVSPFTEIRRAIRPTVANLAGRHLDFGKKLLFELLPFLQNKEAYEGLYEDLHQLFVTALAPFLPEISQEVVLRLVHASRIVPQQFGLFVLMNHLKTSDLTVRQIVRLADHETLGIRQWAWQIYSNEASRMRFEAEESLRILDSTWADTRQFAFSFFRTHFTAKDWTPTLLVSVCDSTKPDVQAFGWEVITRFFQQENGETYLLQLSQHPTQTVQVFATNYLEQFATDNLENIQQLEYYFVLVLSQVNRSGVAKARIFRFLHKEALKHEKVAQLITDILARQSVTMAVQDKAACIEIMRDLAKKYPGLQMPLTIKSFATWTAKSTEPVVS